jgi:hypothetical protein
MFVHILKDEAVVGAVEIVVGVRWSVEVEDERKRKKNSEAEKLFIAGRGTPPNSMWNCCSTTSKTCRK